MTLSEYLKSNGLTDDKFAALVGMSQSQITRLKNGLSRPSWDTVEKIFAATGGVVNAASWQAPAPAREPAQ